MHKITSHRILIRPAGGFGWLWKKEAHLGEDDKVASPKPGSWVLVAVAWLLVGVPLLWGIWTTLKKAIVLFR